MDDSERYNLSLTWYRTSSLALPFFPNADNMLIPKGAAFFTFARAYARVNYKEKMILRISRGPYWKNKAFKVLVRQCSHQKTLNSDPLRKRMLKSSTPIMCVP